MSGLDWRDARHYAHRDLPCVLCSKPTPLRSHTREAVHKTCAEAWSEANPAEVRFVTDTPRTARRAR